jgi:phosphatidylinositol alpha 1,6-mannosyltransferase
LASGADAASGFHGVLRGEQLAEAHANMDVFVFPSRTDTYENVVLEALASGVPAMVSDSGGPRFIVGPGETGFVAKSLADLINGLMLLASQPELLKRMRCSGRKYVLTASWDSVFESLYARYDQYLRLWSRGKQIGLGLPGIARPSNLHQTS